VRLVLAQMSDLLQPFEYGILALNSLYCADVPLSNYSLTHYLGCRMVCDLDANENVAYSATA